MSLLPIFLHKRIYLLRNYQSRKARILFGLGWVYIPLTSVALYFNSITTREIMLKYEVNRDLFTRMLETGDLNVTNPSLEWVDA